MQAGLPEDDEAKQLARAAQAAGSRLEDLVSFQHQARPGLRAGSESYEPSTAGPAEESAALYQEMGLHCSREEFERFIAQQAGPSGQTHFPRVTVLAGGGLRSCRMLHVS